MMVLSAGFGTIRIMFYIAVLNVLLCTSHSHLVFVKYFYIILFIMSTFSVVFQLLRCHLKYMILIIYVYVARYWQCFKLK